MCWLPVERRDGEISYLNRKVCVSAYSGAITILDFASVHLPPFEELNEA
jgi:hypothetical protein